MYRFLIRGWKARIQKLFEWEIISQQSTCLFNKWTHFCTHHLQPTFKVGTSNNNLQKQQIQEYTHTQTQKEHQQPSKSIVNSENHSFFPRILNATAWN